MLVKDIYTNTIDESILISRDLSWLKFNYRVLDQARNEQRNVFEKMKFLAITASNLDEFFMIRVGSLYNYIDYDKDRVDYSGLRAVPFKDKLLSETQQFVTDQNDLYAKELTPLFKDFSFKISKVSTLYKKEKETVANYFKKTIFPMLTPMVYDNYHTFPILMNNILIFGVATKSLSDRRERKKMSFVQIPQNLPRFYELRRKSELIFVPIEEIIREYLPTLFRNVEVNSTTLFRVTRNGDFTLEESDDIEANFLG